MTSHDAKTALSAFLRDKLSPEDLRDASKLIGASVGSCVREAVKVEAGKPSEFDKIFGKDAFSQFFRR